MSEPTVRAPIVLIHGLLGFDQLRLQGWTITEYFPGIPEALEAAGNRVFVPRLSPTSSVAVRAGELQTLIDAQFGDEPVHLIAHSMGGLDSRYLISQLGQASRVQTLTTLGTPHHGTFFADWGTTHIAPVVQPFVASLGIPTEAFYDLTRARCKVFNRDTLDDSRVRYFSIAGQFKPDLLTPDLLTPSYEIIWPQEGANDGLVSVASATWGTFLGTWEETDHAGLINWPNPSAQLRGLWRDRVPDYLGLVARLADEGF